MTKTEKITKVEVNGREYLIADLSETFDKVADPKDWRAPINTTTTFDDIREGSKIKAAVEFFTGTTATLRLLASHDMGWTVHVKAVGYRNGPCGP